VIVVLLSPQTLSGGRRKNAHLLDLGAQLLEMANWRDLQAELRALPLGWSREAAPGQPARVCVVEPNEALPGGVLGFDASTARSLIARGEADALRALERAGWSPPSTPPPAAGDA
jgi:hypothetical protein